MRRSTVLALHNSGRRCYLIRVKRVLTLLMMATLTLVNGTALAAAMCVHQDAAAHASALHAGDTGEAAVAHMEEAAGSAASKQGTLADAGSLMLPAFVMPSASDALQAPIREAPPSAYADEDARLSRNIAPLLEPPAA